MARRDHKYNVMCGCSHCERETIRRSAARGDNGGGSGRGGMHVGRPHTSRNDPRVHVTSTLRDSNGKKIRNDTHQSSLGAIAYGQTAYEASQDDES